MNATLEPTTEKSNATERTLVEQWLISKSVQVTFRESGIEFSVMDLLEGEHYWTFRAPANASFDTASALARRDYYSA